MNILPAKRISNIKPYYFSDLEKEIVRLKKTGMNIIRLDMGSPDLAPDDFIIESLVKSARQPDMHGYGQAGGSLSLRTAFATYYNNRFGVSLDPGCEVLGLIGSKEGLFNLSQVLVDQGDIVLIPDPCYPVYSVGADITQAEKYFMPLVADNNFLPDLSEIPEEVLQKTKLMWLNYPNNPTGAIAPYSFFEEVVAFARKHSILIAHDAPYVDVCFDNYQAHSILEVPGAREVAVEFNSLSKTYNMAGWRVGVAVGNKDIIRLLSVFKSQLDSSHFKPIMLAAEAALLNDQSWISGRNRVYQQRRDVIANALRASNFSLEIPKASLYVWAKLPKSWPDSLEFCNLLLHETGVSITPGVVYGPSGAGYVRISLVTPVERCTEAMDRMTHWMSRRE